jgi:hypothetical protein
MAIASGLSVRKVYLNNFGRRSTAIAKQDGGPATGTDAMPLLCIEKKNGTLRTVVDARLRNANTFLDVTPLPDLDMIRDRFARAKFRSKIDMTNAYEQICIVPEDVWKTLFAFSLGTFESLTLQQGDCNGPSTFQRLMTWVFCTKLGTWVFVYIDDIFVFTNSFEEHEEALDYILTCLRRERLFISDIKFFPYAERIDCLGYIIDDQGIHLDTDKLSKI